MTESSQTILERFRAGYGKDIDLTLRPAYGELLARLGDPHKKLPPVFHVAGTNGKGSTCAFLRAMLGAGGYRVHVYTSPHLVQFHERIRIAGRLISEPELAEILSECEKCAPPGGVTYFEVVTAAALVAFARHPADFTILEVGFGGRLDATNIVDDKLATVIARLSFDHREYLGDSMDKIAREKAGIMRPGVPCFAAHQPDALAARTLREAAVALGAPLAIAGEDWRVDVQEDGFRFSDAARRYDLPEPALLGRHQYDNAGLAIAALAALPKPLPEAAIAKGLRDVEWPGRLQRLAKGPLAALVPDSELWLDGGHNDSAGEALAAQIEAWRREDGDRPRPLCVVLGMLTTKNPAEFIGPFAASIAALCTVDIAGEPLAFGAAELAARARQLGVADVRSAVGVEAALTSPGFRKDSRILILGSLYLAGVVLTLQDGHS